MELCRLTSLALVLFALPAHAQTPSRESRPKGPTLYERLASSTVSVSVSGRDGKEIASGSGVILSAEGLVLTNYHVVEGGVFFDVRVPGADGPVTVPARASKCAPEQDLAVLSVRPPVGRFRPVKVAAAIPKVGERVLALGSPLALEGTLTDGIVSQVRRLDGRTLIQTTAPISPGSSGGGLFLSDGQLVGVTTMTLRGGQGLNFAVSSQDLSSLVPCTSFPAVGDGEDAGVEPTPAPTPKPRPCPAKLVLTKMTANMATTASEGAAAGVFNFWLEGLVENRGCTGASFVKVMVEETSPAGEFVTSNWAYASPERIAPGGAAGFKVLMDVPERVIIQVEKYKTTPHFEGRILDDWVPD